MKDLKILLLDTEWTYALGYFFPDWKPQYMSDSQIKVHQVCVCAAWKWLHEVSIYSVAVTDLKKFRPSKMCDKNVAVEMHRVMTDADVIVAHNGDKFDLKMLNALFDKHGLGPIPQKKTIDTLKVARKHFRFAGNGLDSLSKRFGGEGKKDRPDWKKMTDGDRAEIVKSVKYCKIDVAELERVFVRVRPYMHKIPTLQKISRTVEECHACGSKRLRNKGNDFDGVRQYRRIKCLECGHNHKAKI